MLGTLLPCFAVLSSCARSPESHSGHMVGESTFGPFDLGGIVEITCARQQKKLADKLAPDQIVGGGYTVDWARKDALRMLRGERNTEFELRFTSGKIDPVKGALVLWTGFSDKDTSGKASRWHLSQFVHQVGGSQLADTKWGRIAEGPEVDQLSACDWDQQAPFWRVGSKRVVNSAFEALSDIWLVVNWAAKNKRDSSVLYRAELPALREVLGTGLSVPHPGRFVNFVKYKPRIRILDMTGQCSTIEHEVKALLGDPVPQEKARSLECLACDKEPARCV